MGLTVRKNVSAEEDLCSDTTLTLNFTVNVVRIQAWNSLLHGVYSAVSLREEMFPSDTRTRENGLNSRREAECSDFI